MRISKKIGACLSLALGLVACSDMGIDETEATGLPDDYSLEKYLELNPDIKYQQARKDLKDHGFYNQARLDTIKKAFITPEGEIVIVAEGTMPPTGAKIAKDARAAAQANMNADNEAFLADSAFAHKVFSTYVGFADSLWKGVDSLDSDEKAAMFEFNKQQTGKPNLKEDKAFLEKFPYDESLMEQHYLLLGSLEGRAYRYCTKSDKKSTPFSKVVPDTLGSAPAMLVYSAWRFCYDSKTNQKYVVK